ncbi:hypothetical protein K443DRAFT_609316 [Laccaria amethystina LaAM-08-1]|uniref:Unplaced genomic scaffold K443scaffold_9, whole genome shotgun sequence n=1 Tax=Laccaria amethystina LaAM-08-1 TaxID=1095629 RepID=A0A0C9Y2K6_9AGAR|nr:hypothetical protein K443DRAFT_609316 [Laccaria amethystina LaAM-08-1]
MSCDLHDHLAFETGPPAAPCLTCEPFQIGPKTTSWTNGCQEVSNRSDCRRYFLQGSLCTTVSGVYLRSSSGSAFSLPKNTFSGQREFANFHVSFLFRARRMRSRARPKVQLKLLVSPHISPQPDHLVKEIILPRPNNDRIKLLPSMRTSEVGSHKT